MMIKRLHVPDAIMIASLIPNVVAAAPPLAAYGALPGVESPELSPSGKRVSMLTTLQGKRTLLVVELGGKALLRADVGDLKIRDVVWAGEDYVLAVFTATQDLGVDYSGYREEMANVLVLDLKQSQWSWPLENSRMGNAVFGFYGTHLQNERWYAHVGTISMERNASSGTAYLSRNPPQLSRIDLATGKAERVA